MACILKAPSESGKGVVVFTTPERDRVIRHDPAVRDAVAGLKEWWMVGLHHNWHDHAFVYDRLFDFSMAGEGDLVTVDGAEVPLITLDACNFVPSDFQPGGTKFWDVLYVTRPVAFKGVPRFLDAVRSLYDSGRRARVLCVCTMPKEVSDDASVMTDLEDRYEDMFSDGDRRTFTLWTPRYDYPFPLDLPTLAHLYRSSRAFVHFADNERRCRVAGYAWSSGLPVVAMAPVGSLLPAELRRPPYFYEAPAYEAFPELIVAALGDLRRDDVERDDGAVRRHFAPEHTTLDLRRQLAARFPAALSTDDSGWALADLDIRLGRHHGIGTGPNGVRQSLAELILAMRDEPIVEAAARDRDPERAIADSLPSTPVDSPRPRRLAWLGRRR